MYTYENLKDDIAYLSFNGAKTGSIGRSHFGNEIFYIHVGPTQGGQIIITGGIHARENVTSSLVIRQAFALKNASMGVWFLPMLNPDGAILIEKGSDDAFLLDINGDDFSLWKANGRGVDLNVNFDAAYGTGKHNIRYPAPMNYIGKAPFSENETAALRDFTLDVMPKFTVSYHAVGREVYWEFFRHDSLNRKVAQLIANELDYTLVDGDLGSSGGYKDWCVQSGIPAVTIEIGDPKLNYPISDDDVAEDISANLLLPQKLIRFLNDVYGS